MFGKPKQLKKLSNELMATKMSVSIYDRMPESNRRHFMATAPGSLAKAVSDAVNAGHREAAEEMVREAAGEVPAGATPDRWAQIMAPAMAAVD